MGLQRELHLARPGLIERVSAALSRGAVVVVAAAGYGKTTLLEDALATTSSPTAWLRCSPADRDPRHLLVRLVSALADAVPGACDELRDRLRATAGPIDSVVVARDLVDELEGLLVDPVVVVIDDAENLVDGSASLAIVAELLRGSAALRLAVASRRPLGVPMAKLRMRGRVVELGTGDLAFDGAECAELLGLTSGSTSDAEGVDEVMASTQGWPLALAAIGLRTRVGRDGTGRGQRAGHEHFGRRLQSPPEVGAFLAEEVLAALEPTLRGDVLVSSVPRLLTPVIVAELGLQGDFLDQVRRRGLFLRPLGDRTDALAYPPLVRDLLLEVLVSQRSPSEIAELNRRSARGMATEGLVVETIEHWISAADWPAAAAALSERSGDLLVTSPRLVERWLDRLPETQRAQPAMQVVAGQLAFAAGRLDASIAVLRGAVDRWPSGTGGEWVARYMLMQAMYLQGEVEGAIEVSAGFESAAPEEVTMAAAAGMHAAVCLAALGRADDSERVAASALRLAPQDAVVALDAVRRVYFDLPAGHLGQALARMREPLDALERSDPFALRPTLLGSGGFLLVEQGEAEEARRRWRQIEVGARRSLPHFAAGLARACQALLLAQDGRDLDAESTIAAVDGSGWGWLAYIQEVARAVLAAGHGDRADVLAAATRATETAASAPALFRVLAACDLVAPLLKVGALDRARRLLLDTQHLVDATYPHGAGRLLSARLAALSAATAAAAGDQPSSDGDLRQLFRADADEPEHCVIRREWERVRPLVWSALERGVLDPASTTITLVNAFPDGLALVPFVDHPDRSVSQLALAPAWASGDPDGALRVLKRRADPDTEVAAAASAIAEGQAVMLPPRVFSLLGGFAVRRGAWPIDDRVWGRPIAARLVRYLLVAGGNAVADDVLIEAFWPELSVAGARRSLQVTASRVRAALDHPGAAASVLEAVEGTYRLHLDERDIVDTIAFERAATQALARRDAVGLRHAASLWAGEPLPEERYADWATSWRARLVDLYAAVLAALADACHAEGNQQGAVRSARELVALDPFNEDAHRALMVAYARAGQRAAALRQYLECRQRLVTELGIEPTERTVRLHGLILADEHV